MVSGADDKSAAQSDVAVRVAGAPTNEPPQTLEEALRLVREILAAAGMEDPQREARALVAMATGLAPLDILTEPNAPLDDKAKSELPKLLKRRSLREPLSRIAGTREFYGRSFEVSPATLDPRADSETLIDAALELIDRAGMVDAPIRILDIGTGTGCLIITLLAELPNARGTACDISPEALKVATRNAERLEVADRLELIESDLLENIEGRYNLIISNPPYIPSSDIDSLDREVRDYDPPLALDGGHDGLDFYRRIVQQLKALLADTETPAFALFEVGAGQAEDVETILVQEDLAPAGRWKDLGGHTRCVAVQSHD